MGIKRKVAFGAVIGCLMILAVATSSCSLVGQGGEQPSGVSGKGRIPKLRHGRCL